MNSKIVREEKRAVSWLSSLAIALCLFAPAAPAVPVTALGSDTPVLEGPTAVAPENERHDFMAPTRQKHAYDPFAKLETEEETRRYRESVEYETGSVIVKVAETKSLWDAAPLAQADDAALAKAGVSMNEATELSRRKVRDGWLTDTYEVTYQARLDSNVWDAVDALAETEGVLDAQPNYLYKETAVDVPTVSTDPDMKNQWICDDLKLPNSWMDLYNGGITAGEGTVVAVIDTGVDYTHPDLAANMWVNTAEMTGKPGVDDDGNGYVDDIHGCSTVGHRYDHTGDPMDDMGHGTHVAGIIGMTANNGKGGVGVAYGAKIMAVKAGQATGVFSDTDIAEAIRYAAAMGADVINMSFSGTGKSFLIEEALSDAFSHCVLVAAAGNNDMPTSDAPFLAAAEFYPAAYDFVLGVMASDMLGHKASFSNWDYRKNGGPGEYELMAPGVNIFSTLPGGRYALWDGTSMATPIVSAAAALVRSRYKDKDMYTSRFIMGQLASASEDSVLYQDKNNASHSFTKLNIKDSLTKLPKPDITPKNIYFFDDPALDPANDGDGVADAGEVIDIGIMLRNHWGVAKDVTVTMDAVSIGGVANPNIEWLTDSISMDPVGTFQQQGNGFVYEKEKLVGVTNPIRFRVNPDTINDAHIQFNVTVTCHNGMDEKDRQEYKKSFYFQFFVQRGRVLAGTIEKNMTLTAEDYWIIENTVHIPNGVTLTVEPGTQIQFWGNESASPYAQATIAYIDVDGDFIVNGTEENPVDMFPSPAFQGYGVTISSGIQLEGLLNSQSHGDGNSSLNYARIINPRLNIATGRHIDAVQDTEFIKTRSIDNGEVCEHYNGGGEIVCFDVADSIFTGLHTVHSVPYGKFTNVLFDRCDMEVSYDPHSKDDDKRAFIQCTFSGESIFTHKGSGIYNPGHSFTAPKAPEKTIYHFNGHKYVLANGMSFDIEKQPYDPYMFWYEELCSPIFFQLTNELANSRGGYLACVNSDEEKMFLRQLAVDHYYTNVAVGAMKKKGEDLYTWADGSNYQNFDKQDTSKDHNTFVTIGDSGGIYGLTAIDKQFSAAEVLLEFPDTVSDSEILREYTLEEVALAVDKHKDMLKEHVLNGFQYNAVLNNFHNTDPQCWNRLLTGLDRDYVMLARNNYWGTEDRKLIEAQVVDADIYSGLAEYVIDPYLTLQSPELETIYPFVTEAYITDMEGHRKTSCGNEDVQVHVHFNRDMNTAKLPMVSFGPAVPYTDHLVEGRFVDARHWVGTKKITSVIDSGMEYIRIKNAVAASDSWLRTGSDNGRFAFKIERTGAAALTLQASGGENKNELVWTQDDYETMAGFNVYRSTAPDGEFTKINRHLIPDTVREFTDTEVQPGITYYYYFTVMGTDLVESKPSNTATATPADTIKPVLDYDRVSFTNKGEAITFSAKVTDNIGIDYVKVFYRTQGDKAFKALSLTAGAEDTYIGTIPAAEVSAEGMEYYIEVSDGTSLVRDGSAQYPLRIHVSQDLQIHSVNPSQVDMSAEAPVTAYVTGANFTETMTLTVGQKPVEYTFVSSTQIHFVIPGGSLGRTDIRLTDGDRQVRLTNAITYVDSSGKVEIDTSAVARAGEEIRLPFIITTKGDVFGAEAEITLDASLFQQIRFEKDPRLTGAIADMVTDEKNYIKIAVASASALPVHTPVGYVVMTPKAVTETTKVDIRVAAASLNAVPAANLGGGLLTVQPNFSISGTVSYCSNWESVEGVKVTLSNGMVTYTDKQGRYQFTGISENHLTVTLSYSGHVNGAISSQDASLVLQGILNDGQLSGSWQKTAADVDGDGQITSMDAAYILQKNVGILPGDYPGTGAEWAFIDGSTDITLYDDLLALDYKAVLLGDVTGSWTAEPQKEIA